MKLAVTYEDGMVFQHFGHTPYFKIYQLQDGAVVQAQVVSTGSSGHGALAGLLAGLGVQALICGGIGGGAQAALEEAGIALYGGVTGEADAAVEDFLQGKLAYQPDVRCTHHEGHHGHDCGSHQEGHGCGSHGCGSSCHS